MEITNKKIIDFLIKFGTGFSESSVFWRVLDKCGESQEDQHYIWRTAIEYSVSNHMGRFAELLTDLENIMKTISQEDYLIFRKQVASLIASKEQEDFFTTNFASTILQEEMVKEEITKNKVLTFFMLALQSFTLFVDEDKEFEKKVAQFSYNSLELINCDRENLAKVIDFSFINETIQNSEYFETFRTCIEKHSEILSPIQSFVLYHTLVDIANQAEEENSTFICIAILEKLFPSK